MPYHFFLSFFLSFCLWFLLTFFFPFWAAAPKGTKSWRTQGDFCSSIRSFVRASPHSPLNFLPMKVATNHDSTSMSSQSPPVYVDIIFIRLRKAVLPFHFFIIFLIVDSYFLTRQMFAGSVLVNDKFNDAT